MRVIGIDTSLRSTGVGVVDGQGSRLRALASRTLAVRADAPHSQCLLRISEGIAALVEEFHPDAAAIEGVFFARNVRTSVVLGEARGAAIAACARLCIPVYEYAPRRVKQSLVGNGAADKSQVRNMVMRLLSIEQEPPEDEGDALALAVCHMNSFSGHALLRPEPI